MIKYALSPLFLLFSLVSFQSFAQYTYELDKTTRFEKMGVEDGLSSKYTTCIHQDKYGFIWIGSQFGLNLYDGNEVKVFTSDANNPQSIFNDHIFCIYEEMDGTMWFGTGIGFSKFDRANQTFSNYLADTTNLYSLFNRTLKIAQDGDYLWIKGWRGTYRFNKQTEKFISYTGDTVRLSKETYRRSAKYIFIDRDGTLWDGASEYELEGMQNKFNKKSESSNPASNVLSDHEIVLRQSVVPIIQGRDGTIWVATPGDGLLEIINREKQIYKQHIHDNNDTNSIIHNTLYKVFEDSKRNIWIGGEKGFSLLNKESDQFTNYHIPNRSDNLRLSGAIYDINEDSNGELYLNSHDGFFRFNPSTKVLIQYLHDPENPSSLSNNFVRQIIHDRNGQTWIVTARNGINRINRFSNAFRKIQKKPNVTSSLYGNSVSSFLQDSKGNLWVGGYSGSGLNRVKMNKQKVFDNFEHFIFDADNPKSISANSIRAIYEDHDQTLWFGTNNGLNRFNYKTSTFTRFQHNFLDSSTISSNNVEAIFQDNHGTFWIGTSNGLNIMDRKTGTFIRFMRDANDSARLSGRNIRVIFEGSNGDVWFGGVLLEKLNRKDSSFIYYPPDTRSKSDVYRLQLDNIEEDDSANLWISSKRGGLYKMSRSNSTFSALTTNHGLPSNSIADLEIDDKGNLWVASGKGLSRIDPNDYSIRNFDVADGLINLEINDRSLYKDSDGWLYVGGKDGFNVFHPDSIKENTFIPPVYITSLTVSGQKKNFNKPLYEMSSIELQSDEDDLSFDFVALNYINPQKNEYAFMLEGYDEDWNHVGNRRTAFYTNLSPGKYTFRVKASNNDGYWNEEGAILGVIIHPPFWKTWWAYILYVVFIISIFSGIAWFFLRRQRLLRDLEIKHIRAEQLEELDIEKNKFFSNISHEFRTPLTLILGPLDRFIAKLKSKEQKQELNLVRRNARRLQTLINQLLSLSKLEEGKMKLRARPENIVKLTRLFLQSFHSMAENRGIKLEFESDTEEHLVYIDTIKYEKVVNNLLSNAFKFTERGGKILTSIVSSPEVKTKGVILKFTDTGSGIKQDDLPHVFDRFYQVDETQMKTNLGTGIGLALTKELIELHYGTIEVESVPGMGTTFTVFLLTGKDHLSDDEIVKQSKTGLDEEDELLNDDYLFVQDVDTKTESRAEVPDRRNLPLVLIVEDNEDMRTYIKSYLVDLYQIIEATNGKEGAEKAIEQVPDLIVSDLMMPKLDGNEMTAQLKTDERTSHIPIILLTAKASKESKLEGLETGADDFLTKPFDADELLIRIKNLIEQRRRLRKLLAQHLGDVSQLRLIDEVTGRGMNRIDEEFLEKATNFIDTRMADPEFTVELLAGEMAMSRMQLHRKMKGLTDQSASDFIRHLRLKKAADLLKEGSLNITQISYEVGISSPSYFAKAFKDQYGVTPSDYT
jgi:signal transduction histidine kinase/ligand-binding sensor domain-containing protein/DNA-binding response OmpR family regulator